MRLLFCFCKTMRFDDPYSAIIYEWMGARKHNRKTYSQEFWGRMSLFSLGSILQFGAGSGTVTGNV